jgi:pullulanase/glycogen debranching enzyme
MINAHWQRLTFSIQETAGRWSRVIDTSLSSPDDFLDAAAPLEEPAYAVDARSVVILVRPK